MHLAASSSPHRSSNDLERRTLVGDDDDDIDLAAEAEGAEAGGNVMVADAALAAALNERARGSSEASDSQELSLRRGIREVDEGEEDDDDTSSADDEEQGDGVLMMSHSDLAAATADLERWLGGESQPLLAILGSGFHHVSKEIHLCSWKIGRRSWLS